MKSMKDALVERVSLKEQVEKNKPAEKKPVEEKTSPGAVDSSSPFNIETARTLVQAGSISKGDDGTWVAKNSHESGFAEALNRHDTTVNQTGKRAMELLATDPSKFAEEYLGDVMAKMREQITREVADPLRQELQDVVRKPSAADEWYESHQEDLEKEGSPLKSAYQKVYSELAEKHSQLRESLGDKKFGETIHAMTWPQAELRAKTAETTSSSNGEGNTNVTQGKESDGDSSGETTSTVTEKPLIESLNDGDEVGESGERNNSSSRSLNEHSRQIGDQSEPITSQGRIDFDALARKSADSLGIKL